MNKIVASVGLVALSASGLQAAVPGLTSDASKPWSVSASLRGFYDDNVNTSPSGPNKRDTFGFEVSPAVNLSFPMEQTTISLGYIYAFKYYDRKPIGNSDNYDQTHTLNAALDHAFSERYQISVRDSFAIGQEPDFLRTGNSFATFQRISGNNIRNYGSVTLNAQLTRLFGLEVGYSNSYFDYEDEGGDATSPSLSGLLDRIEHTAHIDARWVLQPQTVGVFGYQFRQANYTGNEEIGVTSSLASVMSRDRDFREHYVYVGVDHTFRPDLTGSVRVGGRYIEFYNDPTGNGNGWGPYAVANLRWTYAPESYVELGLSHDINATDVVGGGTDQSSFTSSAESTVVYGSVHHRFTPKLHGSLLGQFQNSEWSGGSFNGQTEQYYLIGLNLTYQFTPHFSGEVGYNYDKLVSVKGTDGSDRSFDRNRVYIGVTASY